MFSESGEKWGLFCFEFSVEGSVVCDVVSDVLVEAFFHLFLLLGGFLSCGPVLAEDGFVEVEYSYSVGEVFLCSAWEEC